MIKEEVSTENAPGAIGPYSQCVKMGRTYYLSGQIPLDPETGKVVEGGIAEQTRRVMENIKAVLESAGSNLDEVVKTTVFLTDMGDFAEVNGIYGEYFTEPYPARSAVGVRELPKGVSIEIEALAVCSDDL